MEEEYLWKPPGDGSFVKNRMKTLHSSGNWEGKTFVNICNGNRHEMFVLVNLID